MPDSQLAFGVYVLDTRRGDLRERGAQVDLPPLIVRLLVYLAANRSRTVSIDELRSEVWRGVHISDSAVHQAIRQARLAVGDDGRRQRVIRTFARSGYRFVAEIDGAKETAAPVRRPYVGRRALLTELDALVANAVNGQTRLIALSGDPGIGKTRTLDEIARLARSAGMHVARGAGSPHAGAPPFWPWVQALRDLALARPVRAVVDELESLQSSVRAGESARPDDLGVDALGAASRFRLFDQVGRALRSAAALGPVAILLDDLHDAGPAALELFEFLARELGPAHAVMVAVAYRPVEVLQSEARAAVIARLTEHPSLLDVRLEGLTTDESRALVASYERRPLEPMLLDALVERADGNPFYLVELTRDLYGATDVTRTRDDAAERVGRSMQRLIEARVAALGRGTRSWLCVAAAVGLRFEAARLRALLPAVDCDAAVDEARTRGFVVDGASPVGELAFSHALIRDAVYAQIAPGDRRALHLRIAEQLQDHQPVEAAFHFAEAAPLGGVTRAVEFLRHAARVALAQFDAETAGALYGRARALLDAHTPEEFATRCDLMIAFGRTSIAAGCVDAGREALDAASELARRHGFAARLAAAALAIADSVDYDAVAHDDLIDRLRDALERLQDGDDALRAQLLSRLALELRYRPDGAERAERMLQEALALARTADDVPARARVLEYATLVRWSARAPAQWIELSHELVRTARQAGDAELMFRGIVGLVTESMQVADRPALDREIDRSTDLAERFPAPFQRASRTLIETAKDLLCGDFPAAERGIRVSLRTDVPGTMLPALTQLYYLHLETGRLEELEDQLVGLHDREPHRDSWKLALARLYVETDRHDAAKRCLAETSPAHAMARDRLWLPTVALMAEVVSALDEKRTAAALIELLDPFASLCAVYGRGTLFYGSVSHYLGLLWRTVGDAGRAEACLRRALSVHDAMRTPPWQLRTGVEIASLAAERQVEPATVVDMDGLLAHAAALPMPALRARLEELS